MSKYDMYGNEKESPIEKMGHNLQDLANNIAYSVTSTSDNIRDFISPPRNYRNNYSHKSTTNINWGFVATRGALSAAVAFTVTTAVQVAPQAWDAFTHRQASAAEPPDNIKNPLLNPTAIPIETPTELPKSKTEYKSGFTLQYDESGLLTSYETKSGIIVKLDQDKVKQLKETAASSQESQIIDIAKGDTKPEYQEEFKPTFEKPLTTEMPADIISEQELNQRGITIIQTEKGAQLSIRKAAFNKGELLAAYTKDGKNKLKIILFDTGSIPISMDENATNTYRQNQIELHQSRIDLIRAELQKYIALNDAKSAKMMDQSILDEKILLLKYENASDTQIQSEASQRPQVGLYKDNIVYIAVGKNNNVSNQSMNVISIDPTGRVNISAPIQTSINLDMRPKLDQSYPNPSYFNEIPGAKAPAEKNAYIFEDSYKYSNGTPGFSLRHELEHDNKITLYPTGDFTFDTSEFRTDEAAMKTIQEAFENWIKNGDNSLYYFMFTNPDGSMILTKSNPNTA